MTATIDPSKPYQNTRWEHFAQRCACGESQTSAFLDLYPKSKKWTTHAVHVHAHELAQKVRPRIRFLQAESARGYAITREERVKFLFDIMHNPEVEARDRIKACELLSRMEGDYVKKPSESRPITFNLLLGRASEPLSIQGQAPRSLPPPVQSVIDVPSQPEE